MLEYEIAPNLKAFTHGFFKRKGGVSKGIYNSLNCGMSSKDKKKALLVGIGKWGEVLANILIKKGYQVSYVSRDKNQNLSFEKKFKSDFIKFFSCNDEIIFDLVVIAVQPKDFYSAWKEYKIYSKKFLIEKPGALNKNETPWLPKKNQNVSKCVKMSQNVSKCFKM